jgi:putative phosphoribosyl transferase
VFANRQAAGRALARVLEGRHLIDPVVLALPRGGVPVAMEIARALAAPLDLVLVRKIGVPFQPELAAAAVVDGGEPEIVVNDDVVGMAGMSLDQLERAAQRQLAEIERRRQVYLQNRHQVPLAGKTLILVDDGIATGATVRAALKALKRRSPKALIVAVPVAPADTVEALRPEVDDLVCLATPEPFLAIGNHYREFAQLSDVEVVGFLTSAHESIEAERSGARSGRAPEPEVASRKQGDR